MIRFPSVAEQKQIVKEFTQAIVEKHIDVVRDMVAKHPWLLTAEMEKKGWTALGLAVKSNDANIVRTLIESWAPLDAKFNGGETPLILATRHASEEIVSMLLEFGANTNRRSSLKMTALSEAKRLGRQDIVEALRSYNLTNSGYKLPKHLPKPRRGLRLDLGAPHLRHGEQYIVQIRNRRVGPFRYTGSYFINRRRHHGNPNIMTHRFAYDAVNSEGNEVSKRFDLYSDGVLGAPFVYDMNDNHVNVEIYRIIIVEA